MFLAQRELFPGFYLGDDCTAGYHHCVFGYPARGTDCPGNLPNSKCCVCNTQYTGEHCDIPCGFICDPDSDAGKAGVGLGFKNTKKFVKKIPFIGLFTGPYVEPCVEGHAFRSLCFRGEAGNPVGPLGYCGMWSDLIRRCSRMLKTYARLVESRA